MSINNDNIVKIGVALKWRNTFDLTKKYYQENVVTACGCVFRCKVLQAQGKSPIKMTDDQGHIVYTNTDVWDVLVDMAYYYNYVVDTRKLTQQMLDYTKKLDEAFQKQQKEIEALQEDNRDQWGHINDIEKVNTEQQRELNSIFDTISCFSEGIWIDTLLWSNETIWDNNKYAITDDLQNQINVLDENHRQDIEDLTEKHNTEISALAADIKELDEHLSKSDKAFEEAMLENAKEHGLVNTHLQKHDREIKDLQDLIKEHDEQIIDLIDTLACFSNGYWDNGLKWSNVALWENSNLMYNTFEDIYSQIEGHQKSIENLTKEIQKINTEKENTLKVINKTFDDFRKEHEDFRKEHKEFAKEHDEFKKEHQAITGRLDGLDTKQEGQQHEIDSLLYRISILTNGVWDNNLLWINESEWTNTNFNGSCHCPTDTEERLDELQAGLEATTQRISDAEDNIKVIISDVDKAITDTNERIDVISEEIDNINQRAEDHQSEYQKMLDDIRAYNGCFEKGEWADPFFWNDTDIWYNSPNSISEAENDIISHNSRLTALESQFALFIQQYTTQQTIIEQHQNQLETLMDCFTVLNVGKWQNLLLWDNTSKWSNTLITEAATSVGTGGSSTVTVKSYDPDTATVTI